MLYSYTHALHIQQCIPASNIATGKRLKGFKMGNAKTSNKNLANRNAQRIAALLVQRATNNANRAAKRNHAAGMLAVQQLCAQYGLPLPVMGTAARANSATNTPSNTSIMVNGVLYKPTKAVHAIAAQCNYVRKATIAACVAAGINAATASTQFAVASKAHAAGNAQ